MGRHAAAAVCTGASPAAGLFHQCRTQQGIRDERRRSKCWWLWQWKRCDCTSHLCLCDSAIQTQCVTAARCILHVLGCRPLSSRHSTLQHRHSSQPSSCRCKAMRSRCPRVRHQHRPHNSRPQQVCACVLCVLFVAAEAEGSFFVSLALSLRSH